jgi:hypothetical protein
MMEEKSKMKSKDYKIEGIEINDKVQKQVNIENLPNFYDESTIPLVTSKFVRFNRAEEK